MVTVHKVSASACTRDLLNVRVLKQVRKLISGFHRALLQTIDFISQLNALSYTKLRG